MQTSALAHDRTLLGLRRRLERWELDHLRQHAAELAERLEHAEESARHEREIAEGWWQTAMDLQQELWAEGHQIGLTVDGQIGVLHDESLVAQRDALLDAAKSAIALLAKQRWVEGSTDPEAVALAKLRAAVKSATEKAGDPK